MSKKKKELNEFISKVSVNENSIINSLLFNYDYNSALSNNVLTEAVSSICNITDIINTAVSNHDKATLIPLFSSCLLNESYSDILDEGLGQSFMIRCASKFSDKHCDKILNKLLTKVKTKEDKDTIQSVLKAPLEKKREFIKETYNKNKSKNPKLANQCENKLSEKINKNKNLEESAKLKWQIVGLAVIDLALTLFVAFFVNLPFVILPVFSLSAIAANRRYKKEHGYSADSLRDLYKDR